jgi:GntR family transcriptional regulator
MESPKYRQIAEELRGQIQSGNLKPGQQLATEGELKERFGASRNTIRDAIKWLISLGLVETRPGQGTFVVATVDPFITTLNADPMTGLGGGEGATYLSQVSAKARQPSYTEPQVEIQKALGDISARMRVPEGTSVISRHQRRFIDETPWSLQTSFYPRGFVAQGAERLIEADDIEEGTVTYLAKTLGLRQVSYQDWIKVRAPDDNEAQFFNLPQDGRVGVFEIFRTAFDQTGTPMRLTVTVFPTDRNQFIVNAGDVPDFEEGGAGQKT